jgi:hypothetical protein
MPRMVSDTENSLTSHQGLWLQVAMQNSALFHATLALSAAYHHNLSHESLGQLALYHIGEAIVQRNVALGDAQLALSDDVLLAVIAVAAYEVRLLDVIVGFQYQKTDYFVEFTRKLELLQNAS